MIAAFGDFEVDLDRLEIRRRGVLVAVEPQVFDVLSYLLEHRERMVRKEELLDNIWGDRFVSESALTSRIKSARQAVGDNGRDQAVIKTVHGRGYRFVAGIELREESAVEPAESAGHADLALAIGSADADAPELDDRWPLVGRHDDVETVRRIFADGHHDGILLTGPAGIGKTRLARVLLDTARAAGFPTAQVSGHAEAERIPLASIAHLIPADVLEAGGADGELARTIVFQRARAALEADGDGHRMVLLVDNADHIDDMSTALVGSLIASGSIFAVLTQRTTHGDTLVADELVRSNQVAHVDLGPLDDTDLDVLLYRVLAGPIDLGSLQQLTDLSLGRPGALQHLVETCLATKALQRQADVWRLVGPIEPSTGHPGADRLDVADLAPPVRNGAEILAVAGDLDLDLATDVVGHDALDALDRGGMLALRDEGGRTRVSLAHPHIELLLRDHLGPLRTRRHKTRLLDSMDPATGPPQLVPDDRVRIAVWRIETGADIDVDRVLAAARLAVASAEGSSADVLLDHLERVAPSAEARHLRAELHFRRGQIGRAEELLAEVDDDELAPATAAAVLRRRATILFHVRARFDEALALLDGAATRFSGAPGALLAAHGIGLRGFLGHADDILEVAEDFVDRAEGSAILEAQRGLAQAHVARGSFGHALALLDRHDRDAASLPPGAAQPGAEVSMATRIAALVGVGRIREAGELVHRHLPIGRRTMLAWLPMAACRAELMAGRPHVARELINTPLAAVRSQNLIHAEPQMQGLLAQALVRLDEADRAQREADEAAAARAATAG